MARTVTQKGPSAHWKASRSRTRRRRPEGYSRCHPRRRAWKAGFPASTRTSGCRRSCWPVRRARRARRRPRPSGGSMERKRPAKRQAWRRSHSSSTAPFQSPARWRARCQPVRRRGTRASVFAHFQAHHGPEYGLHDLRQFARQYLNAQFGWHVFLSAGDVDGRVFHGLSVQTTPRRRTPSRRRPAAASRLETACHGVPSGSSSLSRRRSRS